MLIVPAVILVLLAEVLRLFQPEIPPPDTAIGDSLAEPLARTPDPRGSVAGS